MSRNHLQEKPEELTKKYFCMFKININFNKIFRVHLFFVSKKSTKVFKCRYYQKIP